MSRSPALGVAAYNVESSFAEDDDTIGTRLAILNRVEIGGFKQAIIPSDRVTPYRNQVLPGTRGVKRCEFNTRFYLAGHGSTCAGAITLSDLETLLGIVFGRGAADVAAASSSGGTEAGSGSTSTSLNVDQSTGFAAGSIGRAGVLGDGRGGGQPFVVGAHAAGVITPLTELAGALDEDDPVYSPVVVNVPEGATNNTITSTRWLLQTANQQILAQGCYPKQVEIEARNSQLPTIDITWGGAWWDYVSGTFPVALTMQTPTPAVVAGGSCFLQSVATVTRQLLSLRDFKLTYTMNVVEDIGPGGIREQQDLIGCRRVRDDIMVELTLDADAAGTHTLSTLFEGGPYHLLYGFNSVDGRAAGVYLPYLVPDGDRPTQADTDGINRARLMLKAGTGPTVTTELTSSALRIFLG